MFSKLSTKLNVVIAALLILFTLGANFKIYAQTSEVDLSGKWDFKADFYAEGEVNQWYSENSTPVAWDEIHVPANWKQFIPFQQFDGTAWYRKRFNLPNDWGQKSITLVFENLAPQSKVWLNGKPVEGRRTGNQVVFSKADNWNINRENYVIVVIDNLVEDSIRRQASGIFGKVSLFAQPKSHFGDLIISPSLSEDIKSGSFIVSGSILNQQNKSTALEIKAKVFTYGEDTLQLNSISRTVEAGKQSAFSIASTIKKVRPWSFTKPNLYHLQLDLVSQGDTIESIIHSFGFSSKEIQGTTLKLNGISTKLNGIRYDISLIEKEQGLILKELKYLKNRGVSVIEIPFKLLSKKLLETCDLNGILVWVTMPIGLNHSFGNTASWLQETAQSYQKHPSLLAWGFKDELDSKWVRAIKDGKSNNLIAQVVSTEENEILDNQYADLILLESKTLYSENVFSWGDALSQVPFFVTTSNTLSSDFILSLGNQSSVPSNLLGCIFNKFEQEPSQEKVYINPYSLTSRQHFGIDSLVVTHSGQIKSGKKLKTLIEVRPMKSWQSPSYPLEGHWLAWGAYNSIGKLVAGSVELLKKIEPSDKSFIKTFDWKVPKTTPFQIVYQVLNPQLVPIYMHVVFNEATPNIHISSETLNWTNYQNAFLEDYIYLKNNSKAINTWQVQYSNDRREVETAKFIQIKGIEEGIYLKKYKNNDSSYFVRLKAIHDEETKPEWSDIIEIGPLKKVENRRSLNIVRNENKALLQYEESNYPFCSVEYKTTRESKWKTTSLYKNTGFALIEGLNRREKYSFKLRFHNLYGAVEYTSQIVDEN